jgi:hypothetical protein
MCMARAFDTVCSVSFLFPCGSHRLDARKRVFHVFGLLKRRRTKSLTSRKPEHTENISDQTLRNPMSAQCCG